MKTKNIRALRYALMGLILIAAVTFSSCAVKNEINLSLKGSGTASTDVVLDESLLFYLESLAELTGETSDGPLFNVEDIKKGMEVNPGITVDSIENIGDGRITAEISFDDIEQLIAETEISLNKRIISFSDNGGEKEISIYIDIDNFQDIAPLFPIVEEPLFMTFGPLENQGISEAEYLEMMEYALGEGGGELISNSMITTVINIDGTLISQTGGTANGNSVTFETPLIRVLMLDQPIEYSITFK
ncbi:MAG: hypothetical protein PQJ61_07475 [Spirochaetales bacterium]|uniref:Uncharacterized protein n=1 Tax=Candidatus Thalassospirochaeta sargassi TaxID=3119039 RepID=A0AAJ1IFU0_9SPIO|nr:hypothetical protein [Spirochaetales bacterium]